MSDVYLQDELRIKGITRSAEIDQRVKQDAALRAAVALEQEQRAEALRYQEAMVRQAQEREQAEAQAVEILRSAKQLYIERDNLAGPAIEANAAVVRKNAEIKDILRRADQSLQTAELTVDPTQRGAWRQSLLVRAGLPSKHLFVAPKQWTTTEAQRIGATCIMGVTSSIIGPGWIQVGRDVINFEI